MEQQPRQNHHYQDLGISRAGSISAKLTVVGKADVNGFNFLEGKVTESIGGASEMLLTKKTKGGNETDECYSGGGQVGQSFETQDCAWLFQKQGSSGVVNSGGDRTKIKKIHFGSN